MSLRPDVQTATELLPPDLLASSQDYVFNHKTKKKKKVLLTHINWIFYFKQPKTNTNPSVVSLIPNMINLFTIFNNLITIND